MQTQAKGISIRIHMGAADYSLTVNEPSGTTVMDLAGTSRANRAAAGRMISDLMGLKAKPQPAYQRRHHRPEGGDGRHKDKPRRFNFRNRLSYQPEAHAHG